MSAAAATGRARALADRRAEKVRGMAAAVAWRESRRCPECHALAWQICAHRPDGFGSVPVAFREEWPL